MIQHEGKIFGCKITKQISFIKLRVAFEIWTHPAGLFPVANWSAIIRM